MIFLITSFFFILGDYYLRIHILSREYYLPLQSILQHSLTPSFTQGRLLFVLIFNIYIGQSNYLKISLLGPPMVDPTPVSLSIAIINLIIYLYRYHNPVQNHQFQNLWLVLIFHFEYINSINLHSFH